MQFLIGGARANVGLKGGRYMYEVKVLEVLNPDEGKYKQHSRTPQPKQLIRVGFSTAVSPLLIGEEEGSVAFDADGTFLADGMKTMRPLSKFGRDQVIGVLLNLDPKSPNANTVSLFRDGERISQPQPIPECMRGKALFPHVNFKNVTLQVNFGLTPMTS